MRVIRYLKHSIPAVLLILVLLVVQAFADLSLPNYTSDLVDVGIQQGGIKEASPEAMQKSTFEYVCMFAEEEDEELIRASYDWDENAAQDFADQMGEDGVAAEAFWVLNEYGEENRSALNAAVALPLVVVGYAEQIPDMNLEQAYGAYSAGMVAKADILALLDQAQSEMGGMPEEIVQQQAVQVVKMEYEALGFDLNAIQMDYLVSVGLRMLGVAALMMAASIAVGFVASRTAARVAAGLRERFFAKVVSFSNAEIQSFSAASLITRGTNDIQQIQMVLTMILRMILYSPILAMGGIIMVARSNASMSWVIALAVIVLLVVIAALMSIAMPKFKIMQTLVDRVNLVSREILTGLPVIRAFGRQRTEEARFDQANTELMKTMLFTNRVMTFMMPSMMLIMNAASVLIVWVGGNYIDAGTMQTGDMIALITYSMVIIMSFLMMSMVAVMLPRAEVAAGRINEVLETKSSISDPAPERAQSLQRFSQESGAMLGASDGVRIEFDDVTFAYDDGSDPVLEHVSFTAEPGQTTAIIGSTGSGKSTVIKLIERFHDVTSGAVRVGGVDVRDMSQKDLRSQLGYVPQKAFLFSGTIRESVGYGLDESTDERLLQAVDIAQASEFVSSREEGLDAHVSQGGTNISGGQRQRLCIARALATDAPAFLFDDSFSALDYKTDAALRQALAESLGGKTVLIVAQRISTILDADKIVVLDEGRMVGCGTHAQLMDECPTYREIAESQLSPEELEGGAAR